MSLKAANCDNQLEEKAEVDAEPLKPTAAMDYSGPSEEDTFLFDQMAVFQASVTCCKYNHTFQPLILSTTCIILNSHRHMILFLES